MKIAIFTTVHERLETTLFQMKYMNWLREVYKASSHALELYPFYVLSNDDAYLHTFVDKLTQYKMDFVSLPHKNLSTKAQYGLWTLQSRSFDYLMHLDSDEIIPSSLLAYWAVEMEKGIDCFGSTNKILFIPDTQKAFMFPGYDRVPVVNGGMCIKRSVLDKLNWYMWTPGLSFGLNSNEHIRIKDAGYTVQKHNMGLKSPVEIKNSNEVAIHPMEWYTEKYNLKEMNSAEMRKLHTYHFEHLNSYSNVKLS